MNLFLDAIESTDRDPALESKLVKQTNNVRNQYNLNDASVAKPSNGTLNQNGFHASLINNKMVGSLALLNLGKPTSGVKAANQEANV
ncbi:hypothetical protein OH492_11180 [Vibrio chagasii]|nr:hypothetical protein [Vibrio chagasii]